MAEGADCKEEKGTRGGEDEGNGKASKSKQQQKNKEDGDAGKKKAAPVVLGVDLHCDGCARKVIKAAQGVEGVAADVAAGTVTVSGKTVDIWDLKDRVEARTHKPVSFVSPPNPPKNKKDGGDTAAEGKKCQATDGKGAKTAGDDKKKKINEAISKRLHEVATKSVCEPKKTIIYGGGFGDLLNITPFPVPHELIEFVVMKTNHKLLREFRHKNRVIAFNRDMEFAWDEHILSAAAR